MIYGAYCFPSAGAAETAFRDLEPAALDMIGDGYVNAVWPDAEPGALAAYGIPAADAPRWWAGVPREPPAPPPAPVPIEISNAQARVALRRAGLLSAVNAAVAAADAEAQDLWEYGTVLRRDSALVIDLAAAVGLTPDQTDDLFRTAATISG